MPLSDINSLALFAEQVADKSREISLSYFRNNLQIEYKVDESPVTVADRETEALIREMIESRYPDHSIYGEEHGASTKDSPYIWVIDPIDGTMNFVSGMPLYGTLIALLYKGRPVVGVVDIPALNERWVSVNYGPTRFNGNIVKSGFRRPLEKIIWYTTSPSLFSGTDKDVFARLQNALSPCRYGIDCYAFALLASGYVDLVIETGLKPHDYLALIPVIEGAGGKITDWSGKALSLDSDGRVVASASEDLHSHVLSLIS